MSPFAIAIILASTLMHAGWNLLARRRGSETAFFWRMLMLVAVVGLVPGVISEWHTHSLTRTAWTCVVPSGLWCAIYMFALGRAYECSDFTVVYPVVRALPVVLVAFGDVMLGRYPTPLGWTGMVVVVAGCLMAPQQSFRDLALKHYKSRAALWMLVAVIGLVAFTILDKVAADSVKQSFATAGRYNYFFYLFMFVFYAVLAAISKGGRRAPQDVGWTVPAIGSVLTFGSYWLTVWAFQIAPHASYVLAFRQFSIVIGVVFAFILYRERGLAVRLTGTFLVTAGLALIALFGGEKPA